MEKELALLYKYGGLFDGEINFINNKIKIDRNRKFYNNFIKLINYFFVLIHLILIIFDNKILNEYFVYYKLTGK